MKATAPIEPTSAWPDVDPGGDQVGDGRDVGVAGEEKQFVTSSFFAEGRNPIRGLEPSLLRQRVSGSHD